MNINDINKPIISLLSNLTIEHLNKLLKGALVTIQPSVQDRSKAIEKLSIDLELPKEKIYDLLGVYIVIIKYFLNTTDKEFNIKLIELGFPSGFVNDLPLISNRTEIVNALTNSRNSQSDRISNLKWRIDISLNESALQKKVPTNVILSIQLRNGKKVTITVDIKMFHKLRFNIALLVKELNCLKNSHIINK